MKSFIFKKNPLTLLNPLGSFKLNNRLYNLRTVAAGDNSQKFVQMDQWLGIVAGNLQAYPDKLDESNPMDVAN